MYLQGSYLTWARGFEPPTFWSVAKRSIQLSYAHTTVTIFTAKIIIYDFILFVKPQKIFFYFRLNWLGRISIIWSLKQSHTSVTIGLLQKEGVKI